MFKKSLFVLFVLLILTLSDSFGIQTEDINRVKDHLRHSDTYYWISRERNDAKIDIRKNIFHAKKAASILNSQPKTKETENLLHQAKAAMREATEQLRISQKKLHSYSPLFRLLLRKESTYEMFNEINEETIKRNIEKFIEDLNDGPKLPIKLFLIVLAENMDQGVEEIAHSYINQHTSYYVISRHELSNLISESEINQLYRNDKPEKILNKISKEYGTSGLGLLRLQKSDEVDNVCYWVSNYRFWNDEKGIYERMSRADAFCENVSIFNFLFFALIFLGFPATYLFNVLNKTIGSPAPLWLSPLSAGFSIIVLIMAFKGLSLLPINLNTLILSPTGLFWIIVFTLICSLLPTMLTYLSAARLPKVGSVLNNPETISSLLFGTYLGVFTFCSYLASIRLGYRQALLIAIPGVIITILISYSFGKSYYRSTIKNDNIAAIEYGFLLAGLVLYIGIVLTWDVNLFAMGSLIIVLLYSASLLIPSHVAGIFKKLSKDDQSTKTKSTLTGIAKLKQAILEPRFFNGPWNEVFCQAKEFITENEDDKIEVVYIEADVGCGKTRTAREIAEGIKKEFDESGYKAVILFGDCDEFGQESDIVPYEPFAQALGDLLGINRFAPPAEKAEKLKKGLVGKGLKTAMGLAGVGALSSLLDAEDNDQDRKSNTREMSIIVAAALTELSKGSEGGRGKVIFILDDAQWIDPLTFELLEMLFQELSSSFNNNEVSFILTSRPIKKDDKVKAFLKKLEHTGVINVFWKINEGILENEKIIDGIIENLWFDYRARNSLSEYFKERGIYRPLHILQTIEVCIEKKIIEEFADSFVLARGANLKKLPPPLDYKRMVEEMLTACDHRLIDILQCCAVIGKAFRVSIIAHIFNIDVLELLRLLKEVESANIVRDIMEEDDIYEFVDKRMVGIFRNLKTSSLGDEHISQKVREYHKRFIVVKEEKAKKSGFDAGSLPYRDVLSLANHSQAIRDVYPQKAVHYNRIVAEKTYKKGMFAAADIYYKNAVDIVNSDRVRVPPEEGLLLYISYAKCLLDEQADLNEVANILDSASDILNSSMQNIDNKWAENELNVVCALQHFRRREFNDALEKASKVINAEDTTLTQKIRAQFYYAASLPPSEAENRRDKHIEVLADTNEALEKGNIEARDRIEILKVKSEALNNTGFVFLYGLKNPDDALKYFDQAIEINRMPEINDQKGIAIAHGGKGDCLKQLGQLDKAEEAYRVNLEISRKNGDMQGIVRMTSVLGTIMLEKGKKGTGSEQLDFFKKAEELYNESLGVSEEQKNIIGVLFALSGMIETIMAAETYERSDYIIKKLESVSSEFNISMAPEFARNALTSSLKKFQGKAIDYSEQISRYLSLRDERA